MRLFCTTSLLLVLIMFAAPPVAAELDSHDRAEVKIYGGTDHQVSWVGRGDIRRTIPICIATPTGRFSLRVSSASGQGLSGDMGLPYQVTLRSSGSADSGTISPARPMVELEGIVEAASSCLGGANAELLVHLSSADLLSGNAGVYADQITLAVNVR